MNEPAIRIELYKDDSGESPFQKWFDSLQDIKGKSVIISRLQRLSIGSFGEYKHLDKGLYELKIRYGPGYRIYFGMEQDILAILIGGGHKGTQKKDIRRAMKIWEGR
ncbi:MAG: type II toxin-antitoxin system RelE/ParE family toxin [Nitrospinales bacterium]